MKVQINDVFGKHFYIQSFNGEALRLRIQDIIEIEGRKTVYWAKEMGISSDSIRLYRIRGEMCTPKMSRPL